MEIPLQNLVVQCLSSHPHKKTNHCAGWNTPPLYHLFYTRFSGENVERDALVPKQLIRSNSMPKQLQYPSAAPGVGLLLIHQHCFRHDWEKLGKLVHIYSNEQWVTMGYYVTNFFRKQQTSLYVQKHGAEVAATACKRRAGRCTSSGNFAILPWCQTEASSSPAL